MKPTESFVPLTAAPAPAAPREFRVAIVNGHAHPAAGSAEKPGTFQSLATQSAGSLSSIGSVEKKVGEPRVTVQRDGDRVTHLRIQCSCGQIMDLACVYDVPAPPK
jgi:hypothetical protein